MNRIAITVAAVLLLAPLSTLPADGLPRTILELDWIAAAQNEMGTDLNWIRKNLRPTLDARSFAKVKLQAPEDDSEFWQIFDTLESLLFTQFHVSPTCAPAVATAGGAGVVWRRRWTL